MVHIKPIETTRELEAFCERASDFPYLAVDTEFVGEGYFYPQLCLIQLAMPGNRPDCVAAVDPLSSQLSLEPLKLLFENDSVVKVFHSGRQDLAIFFHEFGSLPMPVFDTQLSAMVCGYGQSVGYDALVQDFAGLRLDKSARLLNWSERPLSQKLLKYALDDVIHLRVIYLELSEQMRKLDRTHWIQDELNILASPETYLVNPHDAWKRIRKLKQNGQFLAILRELAAFREEKARSTNKPRNRILSDDAMVHLAEMRPLTVNQLSKSRVLMKSAKRSGTAEEIVNAVRTGLNTPRDKWPRLQRRSNPRLNAAVFELLRVLLKVRAKDLGVAEQILATTDELKDLASGDTETRQLSGWRREVFGNDAIKLRNGRLAITADGEKLKLVDLADLTA